LGFKHNDCDDGNRIAINTLPWERTEIIELPQVDQFPMPSKLPLHSRISSQSSLSLQPEPSKYGLARGGRGIMAVQALQSPVSQSTASIREIEKGVFQLSNSTYEIQVKDGVITSLYDKSARRQVIPKGAKANQLVIYDDKPLYWQAWDVEVYHLDSRKELKSSNTSIVENGPHRVSLVSETKISEQSWVKTTISLSAAYEHAPGYIEISSEVEWHETMKFLKVEFPVDITNSEASYETQFGIIRRPTHYNTTWDMAKFEVICHKWADVSEATYGVSILNDSKYGFATSGNVMRLSLLRAPKAPDAHADMGKIFAFAFENLNQLNFANCWCYDQAAIKFVTLYFLTRARYLRPLSALLLPLTTQSSTLLILLHRLFTLSSPL
jgi:alpha-mannosidase